MSRFIDRTGTRSGRLTVLAIGERDGHGDHWWLCRCDCGNETKVVGRSLTGKGTKSCGCVLTEFNTTHGMSGTPEHRAWTGARDRCFNPNSNVFEYYGGRGITMCDRWRESFEAFFADMGPRPEGDFSLDRIDTNGHYEPGNCRWADRVTQMSNRRSGEELGRTHCAHGHEFTEGNTYRRPDRSGKSRQCRECMRQASLRSRERRKARSVN